MDLPEGPDGGAGCSVSLEDIRTCTRILERIRQSPGVLGRIPEADRIALLAAAGRVARPDPQERARILRGYRQSGRQRTRAADRATIGQAGIRIARQSPVFVSPPQLPGPPEGPLPPGELERPRDCYVCKRPYRRIHFFYDSMCPGCGDENYEKRFQTASLAGRVVLVTGGRVKIGYHTALKVLRAGARTLVTTRFPRDAALRFSREADFLEWADRLQVYGLDLRHTPSVELFARSLAGSLERLDILINNACQTVRRPPGFHAHLIPGEEAPLQVLPESVQACLAGYERMRDVVMPGATLLPVGLQLPDVTSARPGHGLLAPARLSQIPYPSEAVEPSAFPPGLLDADLQQVDRRRTNSWRLTLAQVESGELLEVHLVNAVAPYVLCARLKGLLARDRTGEKHVVNVSAMEGKFTRGTKTDRHPHTNMAKAALNMMTLTAAPDFLRDGIHMNAVDTGWVTDEDPERHARRKLLELDFQPPLDVVDGAARVCDPFFAGLRSGQHPWGTFFKDYRPTGW